MRAENTVYKMEMFSDKLAKSKPPGKCIRFNYFVYLYTTELTFAQKDLS